MYTISIPQSPTPGSAGQGLAAAHRGYIYQDVSTPYLWAWALYNGAQSVTVDRKEYEADLFDDLTIITGDRRKIRRQFKTSADETKVLDPEHLKTKTSDLRIDDVVRCYVLAGQEPADEYRICTTWREPVDPELTQVLEPCAASGTFDGYPTKRYQLKPDALWPPGGSLVWKLRQPSVAMRREDLIGFSERLVDVAARLIFRASHARARQETLAPTSLASELELRTDYGRVAQQFPVVEEHEVLRE